MKAVQASHGGEWPVSASLLKEEFKGCPKRVSLPGRCREISRVIFLPPGTINHHFSKVRTYFSQDHSQNPGLLVSFTHELSLSEQEPLLVPAWSVNTRPHPVLVLLCVCQVLRREQHLRVELKNPTAWVQIPTQTFIACVTLDKGHKTSVYRETLSPNHPSPPKKPSV